MKNKKWLIAPALLILAGLLFIFVLQGYLYVGAVCLGCAVLCWLYHVSGPKARRIYTAVICILVAVFMVIEIPIISAARTDAPEGCGYIIVLGAGVFGTTPSLSLRTRLEGALEYLDANPDAVAIVTGGQGPGEDITEAECMRRWLEDAGVAPERVVMETEATDTTENLRNSFDIIRSRGDDPNGAAVVSSMYHLYRAKELAKAQGVTVYGVAAPMGYLLVTVNYFIREGLGRIYYWVYGVPQ